VRLKFADVKRAVCFATAMPTRLLTTVIAAAALTTSASAATIVALGESGGNVFSFDTATPGTVVNNQSITGVPGGQSVRAIDFRPSNGLLYMLSTGATTSDARLYTLNATTGAATVLGSLTLTGATGTRHSLDWNPVSGLLHVVSASSRSHFTIDPTTLAVSSLGQFAAGTNLTGLAFDNNFAGSASTSAYVFEINNDELRRVTNLATSATTVLGAPFLPFFTAFNGSQGLDINGTDNFAYFNTDMFDGPQANGADHLFTLPLSGGAATHLGQIGLPTLDISVMPIPEPSASAALLAALGLLGARRRR
jgi:hypothetical protein